MKILFFAHLKNATGCDEISIEPRSSLTTEALWAILLDRFPALAIYKSHVRLACNCEYTLTGSVFNPGDEIALIPPVSGG